MRLLRGVVNTAATTRARSNTIASLKSGSTLTGTRQFAHVHDIHIKWVGSAGADSQERDEQGHRETKTEREGGADMQSMERNVFKQPLALHSKSPLTGYMRTGYCEAPRSDAGNHSIAGIVTNEFLDFSAARGNDLRTAGLTDGCKWCLCVSRWKEAFNARTGPDDKKVPKIVLKATNERALEGVSMDDLKGFAVDAE